VTLKTREDLSVEAVAGREVVKPDRPARVASKPGSDEARDRIRQLLLEVAVLEERLAAAAQFAAEREQHIKDLRAALKVMSAAVGMRTDGGSATGRG